MRRFALWGMGAIALLAAWRVFADFVLLTGPSCVEVSSSGPCNPAWVRSHGHEGVWITVLLTLMGLALIALGHFAPRWKRPLHAEKPHLRR
jgi:hypothetical protein